MEIHTAQTERTYVLPYRLAVGESLRSVRAVASITPDFVADKPISVLSIIGALRAESPSGESFLPALLIGRVIAGPGTTNPALQTPRILRDSLLRQGRMACNQERSS